MRFVLAPRFLIGLADIDPDAPTDLRVTHRVARFFTAGGKIFGGLAPQLKRRQGRQHHIGVFLLGYPLHGFGAARPGNPNRRMRSLISSRPNVDIAKAVVLALPAKRTVGGPALDNQIVGFEKSLPRVGRIYLVREILHAGAYDHTRD